MPIEKAFAISAEPAEIWSALWEDLQQGQQGAFTIEESHRPMLLALRVKLGPIRALLTYKITPRESDSEVAVTLEPQSSLYMLFQALTFGHLRRNYEVLLVEGLLNLKSHLEPSAPEDDEQTAAESQA